jgi:hypothetical protein
MTLEKRLLFPKYNESIRKRTLAVNSLVEELETIVGTTEQVMNSNNIKRGIQVRKWIKAEEIPSKTAYAEQIWKRRRGKDVDFYESVIQNTWDYISLVEKDPGKVESEDRCRTRLDNLRTYQVNVSALSHFKLKSRFKNLIQDPHLDPTYGNRSPPQAEIRTPESPSLNTLMELSESPEPDIAELKRKLGLYDDQGTRIRDYELDIKTTERDNGKGPEQHFGLRLDSSPLNTMPADYSPPTYQVYPEPSRRTWKTTLLDIGAGILGLGAVAIGIMYADSISDQLPHFIAGETLGVVVNSMMLSGQEWVKKRGTAWDYRAHWVGGTISGASAQSVVGTFNAVMGAHYSMQYILPCINFLTGHKYADLREKSLR